MEYVEQEFSIFSISIQTRYNHRYLPIKMFKLMNIFPSGGPHGNKPHFTQFDIVT